MGRNSEVHHHVHKSPVLDSVVNQMNSIHAIAPYLFKIRFNILSTKRFFRVVSSLQDFQSQFRLHVSSPPCELHAQPILSSFDLIMLIISGEEYKLCNPSSCSFIDFPVAASTLGPYIFLSGPNLSFSPNFHTPTKPQVTLQL